MQRSWLHRAAFDNLLLKLVSLALALLIFIGVRAEKQSLVYGTVRVSFTAPPGRALVGAPPDELQVSVLGPASRIPRFRFEDIADVNIDLASVPAGFLKFRPDMILLPPEFSVASIRPTGFRVQYAEVVTHSVPVHVALEGQVAPGFRVASVTASPAEVPVRGPEKAVRALIELRTRPLTVEGVRAPFVARVGLLPIDSKTVRLGRKQVEVKVDIARIVPRVVLTAIPVQAEGPEPRLFEVQPSRVDVTVAGPAEVLANIAKSALVARVPGVRSGEARHAPQIRGLPEGVAVRKIDPPDVLVRLRGSGPARRGRGSGPPPDAGR